MGGKRGARLGRRRVMGEGGVRQEHHGGGGGWRGSGRRQGTVGIRGGVFVWFFSNCVRMY